MNIKNQAINGIKWASLASVVVAIAQIIQLLVLSRILDAHDFGLWAIINLIIFYTTIFSDLGVSAAVIHYQNTTQNQLSTLYWVNILTSILLFIIIWAFAPLILGVFHQANQELLLLTATMSLPFSASGILFQNLFQKELQFSFLSIVEISSVVIGITVSIIFALAGFGVWSFVLGQLTNISIKSILLTIRGWQRYKIKLYFNIKEVKSYLKFGSFQIGEKSVNLLNQRLDQVVIGTVIGTEALGYYNFAFNLISKPIALLNPIFTKVAFPLFAKLQNDKSLLQKAYLKLIKIIATINAPIYTLIFITAPIFIPILFGEKWNDSIILVQVLSGVAFFRSVGNPVGSLALAKGRADLGFKWNSFFLVLYIPLLFILGKYVNAVGITLGLLFLELLLFAPSYKYLVKPFIGNVFKIYSFNIVKPVIIASLMFISLIITFGFPELNKVFLIIAQIFLSTIIYLLVLYISDKELFVETLQMIKDR